jgi:hypothetical protein
MKQRITVEQLQELSERQQQKLREWWKPECGDWVCDNAWEEGLLHIDFDTDWIVYNNYTDNLGFDWDEKVIKDELSPLVNIGQMIELLGREQACRTMMREWHSNELADCLWSAVKEVL